jgi:pyruvate/2-oxoglutarate dehydrogenase complex dihydrolipoamide dehydrogenase (E3) component
MDRAQLGTVAAPTAVAAFSASRNDRRDRMPSLPVDVPLSVHAMGARVDLVIVGMGSGGMVAAEFAARLGRRVVVVERSRVGGDCLWTGCVPSKALLAAAKVAHRARHADRFGLPSAVAPIDQAAVWRRVRAVRDEIAAGDDNPDRFRAMGVEVVFGTAQLAGANEVTITDGDGRPRRVTAATILLCPGSRPAIPPIPGLADVGYLTNETIFELEVVPGRLVIVGGGPVGVELAQACRRLDIEVTVLQRAGTILPSDEPELAAMLHDMLAGEGVELHTGVQVSRVEPGPVVMGVVDGRERRWEADAVVVAAGRVPNVDGLALDAVGVATDARGVVVDDRMRTTVPSIYAVGDVVGRDRFTHAAAYQAVRALRDAWFPGRGAATGLVPWTTFTDPELAHVGLTSNQAMRRFGPHGVRVHRWSLEHNDRAHADGSAGAIVLVERRRRLRWRLVGAHVLSEAAGEVIGELALAIATKQSVRRLGGLVHTYPTISTSVQQLGGAAATEAAAGYGWLMRVGRRSRR